MKFNELSIELTHKCILNCIFCSSNSSSNPIIKEEINFNRIKEIINECREKFGIKKISLSGGEPLIYPHFFELLDFILKEKISIIIYTTGLIQTPNNQIESWNDDLIEQILLLQNKYNKKLEFIFDIQAPNKETYESITRIENSFEKLTKTLNKIRNLNIGKESHLVPFKKNYKLIDRTIKFCFDHHIKKVSILRFVPQGRASEFSTLQLNLDEFIILQQILLKQKEKYGDRVRLGHPVDFLFLIDKNCREIKPCRGGYDAPVILPNGSVYPCPAWKNIQELSAGNIYNSCFTDIWNSNLFKIFRDFIDTGYKKIKGLCETCEYLDACKGKCVAQRILFYNQEHKLPNCLMIGPDPMCPKLKTQNESRSYD